MHVGAMFSIKSIEGVMRPAIAGFAPQIDGSQAVILDVGANADCKPDVLQQFAEIGSVYAKYVLGIKNPKVGLMNLGEEEQKGSLATQAAYQLLKINSKVNFIGNMEGRDLFTNKADVIVCDGFTGNVILKLAESIYDLLKQRNMSDPFFDQLNYEAVGGSPILGVNGNVIIGHGVSSPLAIQNMILLANKMVESNIYVRIKEALI
jgi:glycerol-3-phosphate acyltransferase PlsX